MQCADIVIDNNICGEIRVVYLQLIHEFNESQFLPEEQKLLNTIAERVGNYIFHQRLRNSFICLILVWNIKARMVTARFCLSQTLINIGSGDSGWPNVSAILSISTGLELKLFT